MPCPSCDNGISWTGCIEAGDIFQYPSPSCYESLRYGVDEGISHTAEPDKVRWWTSLEV
jgi:hypothetical protein